ncbi:MAG TPA: DUF4303 domain-containing protein [Verrucomicrobiae bacterium]
MNFVDVDSIFDFLKTTPMTKSAFKKLRTAITDAARTTFTKLLSDHPEEEFYAFTLATNNDTTLITASANTEEGLIRRAKAYEKDKKKGLQRRADSLRWNPADWAYVCAGDDAFEEAQKMLDVLPDFHDLDEDDAEKEFESRISLFIESLKALDEEGFFGRGAKRQKITLLVTMGDQETGLLLRCAQELNPAKVYKEFAKAFPTETAGKFKGIGSRKAYEAQAVVLSRAGQLLACLISSSSGNPYVFGFQLPGFKEVLNFPIRDQVSLNSLAVSPDAKSIYAGWIDLGDDEKSGIRCWDVSTKKLKWDVKANQTSSLDASPDGSVIASKDVNGNTFVWDVQQGKQIWKFPGTKGDYLTCIRFSPTGTMLASCGKKGIQFWDYKSGKKTGSLDEPGRSIAFSPDGKLLAIATPEEHTRRDVSIWDVSSRKLLKRLDVVKGSRFRVSVGPDDHEDVRPDVVAFSPDGQWLVVLRSWPGSAVLWDWKKSQELIWMNPNYECLDGAVFLPDGKTVAIAGRPMDGPPLLLWDISDAAKA